MTTTKGGWVYIVTNNSHRVLYTGVTSDLPSRVSQHRSKFYPNSFTAKYNCNKLVYYRWFDGIVAAIGEEKRIKVGSRQDKLDLIRSVNKNWFDLGDEVLKW